VRLRKGLLVIPFESYIFSDVSRLMRLLNKLYSQGHKIYVLMEPCIAKVRKSDKIIYMCLGPKSLLIDYKRGINSLVSLEKLNYFILDSDVWCKVSLFKPELRIHIDETLHHFIEYLGFKISPQGLCCIKSIDLKSISEIDESNCLFILSKCENIIELSNFSIKVLNLPRIVAYGVDVLLRIAEHIKICKVDASLVNALNLNEVVRINNEYPFILEHLPTKSLVLTLCAPAKIFHSLISLCLLEVCSIEL